MLLNDAESLAPGAFTEGRVGSEVVEVREPMLFMMAREGRGGVSPLARR